jgi:tetratricopeptide (TPR) repeat protein
MFEDLSRVNLDRERRTWWKERLSLGPWCWPLPDDSHYDRAAEIAARHNPPDPTLGDVPLVAVSSGGGSLWLWTLRPEAFCALRTISLGQDAQRAWRASLSALPRSVPVLWDSMETLTQVSPRVLHLADALGKNSISSDIVDGTSFGLSFLLAQTSLLLRLPLPSDVIGSARVREDGRVQGVGGLEQKLTVVLRSAPRIARFVVAAEDAEEARAIVTRLDGRRALEILSAATASEALAHVFADRLAAGLVEAGEDATRRSKIARAFFRLAIRGRDQMVDWTPVERGAEMALLKWRGLESKEERYLRYARAVAARHQSNRGDFPLDVATEAWIDGLPVSIRLLVVASLVQQAADSGSPEPAKAAAVAERHLRGLDRLDLHEAHLKLKGALGRLLAVSGDLRTALALQKEAARGFLENLCVDEVSYPLSEWHRLAGALRDHEAYREAEQFLQEVEEQGGLTMSGRPYVELAAEKGRILLGERAEPSSAHRLQVLSERSDIADHVSFSARRWRVRTLEAMGERDEAEEVVGELLKIVGQHERQLEDAQIALDLIAIDRGTRGMEGSEAAEALRRLAKIEGAARALLAAYPAADHLRVIADLYPY